MVLPFVLFVPFVANLLPSPLDTISLKTERLNAAFFRTSVWNKVKTDEIDIFAATVFGNLEEIKDTKET